MSSHPTFEESKAALNQLFEDHSTIFVNGLKNTNLYMVSFIMFGAMQRSLWNTKGFLKNIDESYMVAAVLLRCQMDTLMRLYAYRIHPEPNKMAHEVLYKGADFRSYYVEIDGKKEKFTDKFLHEQLTKIYPWFSNVYKNLSGFVHFGGIYGKLPINGTSEESGEFFAHLQISFNDPESVTENSREELTGCMAETTRIILGLIASFLDYSKIQKDT